MSRPVVQERFDRPTIEVAEDGIGIAEMADRSGLTQDTLRWYEREGLIPSISRNASGRRVFTPRMIAVVHMLVRLRETGMPTADMRRFVVLMGGGSETHQLRIDILSAHRSRIAERRHRLTEASVSLESKISHYEDLIARGLDCDGVTLVRPSAAPVGSG